eukprot:12149157-Alexandrium_andersonii.AAC.1
MQNLAHVTSGNGVDAYAGPCAGPCAGRLRRHLPDEKMPRHHMNHLNTSHCAEAVSYTHLTLPTICSV